MAVILGTPVASLGLVLFGACIAWLVFRFLHQRQLDQIPLLDSRIDGYIADIIRRDKEITRLKEQLSASSPASPQSVFEIRYRFSLLKWRENGEGGDPHLFLPQTPIPRNATLVLEVNAEVIAALSLLVQNIQLEIMGKRLSADDWESHPVHSGRLWLYFPIPPSIHLGKHPARIVATIPKNGSQIEEHKCPPFEIRIARSYEGLIQ